MCKLFAISSDAPTDVRFSLEQQRKGHFSGVVALAKRDRMLIEEAHGMQDREHEVPNSLNTRFRLGSMNKMFTGVAMLQLVQAGRVKLDAPLGTYLPDYPDPATTAIGSAGSATTAAHRV
jgi:CubicO group peptidase (beta-lactamase class C family)